VNCRKSLKPAKALRLQAAAQTVEFMTKSTTYHQLTLPKKIGCLLLLLAFLQSCNIDPITDHGEYLEAPQVHGTYQLTVMQSNDPSNLNDKSNSAINLLDALPCLYISLVLKEDGTLETSYTDLEMNKDAEGNYEFNCGPERRSTGNWSMERNALKMDEVTYLVQDNQLIDARNRDAELIDLVVFTKV
jgi:hypothetical protein